MRTPQIRLAPYQTETVEAGVSTPPPGVVSDAPRIPAVDCLGRDGEAHCGPHDALLVRVRHAWEVGQFVHGQRRRSMVL